MVGEEGKKPPPPTSFSSVTDTDVGISPKNFLTFSFDPFAKLVLLTLLNLNQHYPSKKWFFWSRIHVMISSLIKILELSTFGHLTTSTI